MNEDFGLLEVLFALIKIAIGSVVLLIVGLWLFGGIYKAWGTVGLVISLLLVAASIPSQIKWNKTHGKR